MELSMVSPEIQTQRRGFRRLATMSHKGEVRILHFAVPLHTVHAYRISIENRYKI